MEAIYGAQQEQQYLSVAPQMSQASSAAVSSAANLFTQRPESNTPYAATQGDDLLSALEESPSQQQQEFFTPVPAQDVKNTRR